MSSKCCHRNSAAYKQANCESIEVWGFFFFNSQKQFGRLESFIIAEYWNWDYFALYQQLNVYLLSVDKDYTELLITFVNVLDEDIGGMFIKFMDDTKLGA